MAGLFTHRGRVTLGDALEEDDDVLAQVRYPEQQKFWVSLEARKADIEALVRYHLGFKWAYICTTEL